MKKSSKDLYLNNFFVGKNCPFCDSSLISESEDEEKFEEFWSDCVNTKCDSRFALHYKSKPSEGLDLFFYIKSDDNSIFDIRVCKNQAENHTHFFKINFLGEEEVRDEVLSIEQVLNPFLAEDVLQIKNFISKLSKNLIFN